MNAIEHLASRTVYNPAARTFPAKGTALSQDLLPG
jgi:hypothetical protein